MGTKLFEGKTTDSGARAADVPASTSVTVDLRAADTRPGLRAAIARSAASPYAILVPLRIFIGVGWLRAGVEKAGDAGWWNGAALRAFLDEQTGAGALAFGFYEWIIDQIWYPAAQPLGWLVIAAQICIGAAVLLGVFTNGALLAGIFLNINFMTMGVVSPSAFYIVIQIVLLAAGVGMVFGLDARWHPGDRSALLVAQRDGRFTRRADMGWAGGLITAFVAVGLFGAMRTTDLSPAGVNDPALVLAVVMSVCAATLAAALAREALRSPQ